MGWFGLPASLLALSILSFAASSTGRTGQLVQTGDDFHVADRSYALTKETPGRERSDVHTALVRLTIDPQQAPAAAEALVSDIMPRVRSAPGFVAGYWLEPIDRQGLGIVVFETEEEARAASPPADNWAAPGVAITEVEFRRIAAAA